MYQLDNQPISKDLVAWPALHTRSFRYLRLTSLGFRDRQYPRETEHSTLKSPIERILNRYGTFSTSSYYSI